MSRENLQASPEALELLSEDAEQAPLTIDPASDDGRKTNLPMPGNNAEENRVDLSPNSGMTKDEAAPRGQLSESLDVFETTVARRNDINGNREDRRAGADEEARIVISREASSESPSGNGNSPSATLVEAVFAGDSEVDVPSKASGDPEVLPPSATRIANESGQLTRDQQQMADDLAARMGRELPTSRVDPEALMGDGESDSSGYRGIDLMDRAGQQPTSESLSGSGSGSTSPNAPARPEFTPPGPGGETYELFDPGATRQSGAQGLDDLGASARPWGNDQPQQSDLPSKSDLASGGGFFDRLFGNGGTSGEVTVTRIVTDGQGRTVSERLDANGNVQHRAIQEHNGTTTNVFLQKDGSSSIVRDKGNNTMEVITTTPNPDGGHTTTHTIVKDGKAVATETTTYKPESNETGNNQAGQGEAGTQNQGTGNEAQQAETPPDPGQPSDDFVDPEQQMAFAKYLNEITGYQRVRNPDVDPNEHDDDVGAGGNQAQQSDLFGDREDGTRAAPDVSGATLTPGNVSGNIDWGPDANSGSSTGLEDDIAVGEAAPRGGYQTDYDDSNTGGNRYWGDFSRGTDDDDSLFSLSDDSTSRFDDD